MIQKPIKQEYGKIPPQAISFEEAVLGVLISSNNKDTKYVINFLKHDDFYKEAHMEIFKVIKNIMFKGIPIDLLLVCEELRKNNKLEYIGGPYYITQLTSKISTNLNVIYHARIIKQKALQRKIIMISDKYMRLSFEDKEDVFDLIEKMNTEIKELTNFIELEERTLVSSSVGDELINKLDDENNVVNFVRKTGHKKFDDIIGFAKDKIILTAGGAKTGKSKFIGSLMFKLLEYYNDISIFWVTLEDNAEEVLAQYISSKIFVKSKDIKRRKYTIKQRETINKYVNKFKSYDIEFQEQKAEISVIADRYFDFCKIRKDKFCILVIDNILELKDRDKFKNNENGMYDYVMSEISRIRQRTHTLILPIHHFKDSQQYETNIKKAYRPILSDMKGTEAFRRIPNQVLLLNNPGKYDDLMNDYPEEKDILKWLFICDTGANREDTSDDDTALIRFIHTLDFNVFEEL